MVSQYEKTALAAILAAVICFLLPQCSLNIKGAWDSDGGVSPDTPIESLDLETSDQGDQEGDGGPQCGNGALETGEQCDDGRNGNDKDGCTDECEFTCQVAGECRDGEMCNGDETCDVATHTCRPGTDRPDCDVCGTDTEMRVCISGVCSLSVCGDNCVDTREGEFCDPPNLATKCNDDCTLACVDNNDCPNDGEICNGEEYCDTTTTHLCSRQNVPAEGEVCQADPRKICIGESCQDSACGDHFVDTGATPAEECDDGNITPDDGCENDCSFSCHVAADCDDGNVCNGAETCDASHVCRPGTNANPGDLCTDNIYCNGTDTCDSSGGCTNHAGDPCADDDDCTNESCNEATGCSHILNIGTCYIESTCYDDGDPSPGNECRVCDSSVSTESWTDALSASDCSVGICCSGSCVPGVGLDCCSTADCPTASCSGTASTCGSFTDPSGCNGQNGCTWATDTCSGTYNCSGVSPRCDTCGCTYNPGPPAYCSGATGLSCSRHTIESNCTHCTCTWTPANCQGTATACMTYTDPTLCNDQSGCSWTAYTCQNYQCTVVP